MCWSKRVTNITINVSFLYQETKYWSLYYISKRLIVHWIMFLRHWKTIWRVLPKEKIRMERGGFGGVSHLIKKKSAGFGGSPSELKQIEWKGVRGVSPELKKFGWKGRGFRGSPPEKIKRIRLDEIKKVGIEPLPLKKIRMFIILFFRAEHSLDVLKTKTPEVWLLSEKFNSTQSSEFLFCAYNYI